MGLPAQQLLEARGAGRSTRTRARVSVSWSSAWTCSVNALGQLRQSCPEQGCFRSPPPASCSGQSGGDCGSSRVSRGRAVSHWGRVHLPNDGALGSDQQCVSSDTPSTWLIKKSSFQTTQRALGTSGLLLKRSFEMIIYSRATTFLCVLRILTKLEQCRNCSADLIRHDNRACRTIKHTHSDY